MNKEFLSYRDFLQRFSDDIHYFCKDYLPSDFVLYGQLILKFSLLLAVIFVVNFILKLIINNTFRFFFDKEKFPVMKSIYQARITSSVCNIIALAFGNFAIPSIFIRHPRSPIFLGRLVDFLIVVAIAIMAYRFVKVLQNYYEIKKDYYKIIAINSIFQSLRIFGILIFSIIGICVIFGIESSTILASLGAITAVIVLVFRDTILGFVTGIHVATSKNMKVGDWVAIPKYSIEGNIEDISLLTTKIRNFDKTISTIPTYDLLTTEIRNFQVISDENTRRIKKSIVFNMKSLKFVNDELMDQLKKINLIKPYLNIKEQEIQKERESIESPDEIINGNQLTNIGVFRKYVENYLKNSDKIDQKELVLVRQLQSSPEGLPLEIYCFSKEAETEKYEAIQSDIFDHLLSAAKKFELEIVQKA